MSGALKGGDELARAAGEDARRLDLERHVALDLAALLRKLRPGIDLVAVGTSLAAEGERLEGERAWGDRP